MEKFYSNASWEKIPDSQDDHETFEDARVVCMRLKGYYFRSDRCSIRGKCLKAWVANEKGEILKEYLK